MEKDNLEILLEDISGKFGLVLEGHTSLYKRIEKAEQCLDDKISLVDFKVGVLNQKIDGVRDELNQKIDGVRDELNQKIDGVYVQLNQKIDSVRDELGQKIDGVAADISAHRADTEAHRPVYRVKE